MSFSATGPLEEQNKKLKLTVTAMGNELSGPMSLEEQFGCCNPSKIGMAVAEMEKPEKRPRMFAQREPNMSKERLENTPLGGVGIVFVKDMHGDLYVNLMFKVRHNLVARTSLAFARGDAAMMMRFFRLHIHTTFVFPNCFFSGTGIHGCVDVLKLYC